MIYADYAATSGTHPQSVLEAVTDAMRHPGNAGRGAHQQALSAGRIMLDARIEVAEFFQVPSPMQVVFTSGITQSLNMVIKGILTPKDHVVTTWAEHNSVLRPLYEMQDKGVELTITEPHPEHILQSIHENTRMVVMTHGSNVTGEIYNIAEVGKECRKRGILFVVDTAQTAGSINISMEDNCIDILCFTGHKGLMGPQGTGGICTRLPVCTDKTQERQEKNIFIHPIICGGTGMDSFSKYQPSGLPEALEAGTMNIPGIAGLAAGIRFINKTGINNIGAKESMLRERFLQGVKGLKGVRIYESNGEISGRTAIVSMNIRNESASKISDELEQRFGILTRSGAHCAPLVHEHFKTRQQGMVRFSFGYETTKEEIDKIIQSISVLALENA